jgi:hypothetical protein
MRLPSEQSERALPRPGPGRAAPATGGPCETLARATSRSGTGSVVARCRSAGPRLATLRRLARAVDASLKRGCR